MFLEQSFLLPVVYASAIHRVIDSAPAATIAAASPKRIAHPRFAPLILDWKQSAIELGFIIVTFVL